MASTPGTSNPTRLPADPDAPAQAEVSAQGGGSTSGGETGHAVALRRFKADIFQVLAHPTRIHVVECLREGEQPVSAILEQVGVEAANLSQHLAVLRSRGLVVARREGNQVFYALRHPLLAEVLDAMRAYFQLHLEDSLAMLREMEGRS